MGNFKNAAGGLDLPEVLDMVTASRLLEAFLGQRGQALGVDGGGVQRLGAQCLQVLLAARAAWAADEQNFVVENVSEDFLAAIELMGVAPDMLTYRKELAA